MTQNSIQNLKTKGKSNSSFPNSWEKAWMATPGPVTFTEHTYLFLKGICMGTADIVPGVSGGTIAFITGIYDTLLSAISSINSKFFLHIVSLNFKKALSEFHLRFLFTLFLGVAVAIISTANLMHFLLINYPKEIWSIFFGLISASIIIVSRSIKNRFATFPILILGTIFSYITTGFIPVNTPEESWFILLCGIIAICAMILPGLSGSFILLILGKYAFITATLRNPFAIENIEVILYFSSGCFIGIIFFSRILRYAMSRWHDYTLALLTGIMIGSMRKIWPWKITLETEIIRGKEYILREENIWPLFNNELIISLLLMLLSFYAVLIMSKFSKTSQKNYNFSSK